MADATHAERSKLVQKQKQQRQELEKKVKKLKGAMKEAAQKELEELDGKHEAELAQFDRDKGVATAEPADEKKESASKAASSSAAAAAQNFRERNWSGLSKKELEEECVERGLGKKGSKEDLIQKLIIFHQDLKSSAPPPGDKSDSSDSEEEDDEEDEDDDDDDEDDDDDAEAEAVSAEEMEKQGKREQVVRKAIRHLLSDKCKEGFPISELAEKLAAINVSGFSPEKLGYKTVEKFVKGQPEAVLRYHRKTQMILPPK